MEDINVNNKLAMSMDDRIGGSNRVTWKRAKKIAASLTEKCQTNTE